MHRSLRNKPQKAEAYMIFRMSKRLNQNETENSIPILYLILILLGISIFIISGCGAHNVHLTPPEIIDEIPPIKTGFYTVYKIVDEQVSEKPGSTLIGKMIYLYKDQYFVDETFLWV
jgi:hypothetical protein